MLENNVLNHFPNRSPFTRLAVCAFTLAMTLPMSVIAQAHPDPDSSQASSWGIGVAVGSTRPAYKGMDYDTVVLPMLSYENQYLKLSGPTLELKLPGIELGESQRLNFGIVGHLFDGSGYEASDSSHLSGMAERKSGAWAGAKVEWENDVADVSLELLGDASRNSKGKRMLLGIGRKWFINPNLMLIPQVGVEWVDKNYVDYYYGVRSNEARAGRAAYSGKATVNPEISLTGIYTFDKNHSMMLNIGVKSLGKGIKNSTLVERSSEHQVMVGYKYSF